MRNRRIEARRRNQWPSHGLPREDELQHLAVLGLAHEFIEHGDIGQVLVLVEAELHDDLEAAGSKIVLVAGTRDAPGIPHDAVELAALDCEHDLLRAGIAGNRLELGAEERVERDREYLLIAGSAGRS